MWFGSISLLKRSIEKQHDEKMKLLKLLEEQQKLLEEQQKTLSEIAYALRKLIAQQTKDNIKSDSNHSKLEPIKNKKKDEDRCSITQDDTNLLNSLPTDDYIFLSMENAKSYHSRRASLLTYCDYYA